MESKIIYIGIDPSFRKNGMGVCEIDDNVATFYMFKDFVHLSSFLYMMLQRPNSKVFVTVENSNLDNKTYYTHKDKKTGALLYASQAKRCKNAVPLNISEIAKISRDVGKNQARSEDVIGLCIMLYGEENVWGISPKQKGAKIENEMIFQGLVKAEKITKLEGYKGLKSEQDKRDAFMLAIKGRSHHKLKIISNKIRKKDGNNL